MIETRTREEHHDAHPETAEHRFPLWSLGVALVVLAVCAWLLSPALRSELGDLVHMIAAGNVDALGDRLATYGLWGPVISLGVMVLQGILAPLPAFVVTFANGLAFGAFAGWLISLVGHVLASSVCFALARRLGRRRVESFVSTRGLDSAYQWLERWGPHAVFLTRLVPGISFDAISYAAGLTVHQLQALRCCHDFRCSSRDSSLLLPGPLCTRTRSASDESLVRGLPVRSDYRSGARAIEEKSTTRLTAGPKHA